MPIPHTWLLVENNIIDITADQFKIFDNELYNNTPVYVGPMNDFYRLFKSDNGSFMNIMNWIKIGVITMNLNKRIA